MTHVYKNKPALLKALLREDDTVLDIGFWGQGLEHDGNTWPHQLITDRVKDTWGVDIEYDESALRDPSKYRKMSAESFSLPASFSAIFAGDIIEHLSNHGLFLDRVREHLAPGGRLILTTPNTFNLFNMFEKVSKGEPTVNSDHTCYFNVKTLRKLLEKNGFEMEDVSYVYSLEVPFRESWKKKVLNVLYAVVSKFTNTYLETLVIIARPIS